MNDIDYMIPFTPITLEYRLYFDDNGNIISYTTEKIEGNYIVIDRETYAACRFDIKVIDGQIIKNSDMIMISKLNKSLYGTKCASIDVNILVDSDYDGEITNWDIEKYEYRNS